MNNSRVIFLWGVCLFFYYYSICLCIFSLKVPARGHLNPTLCFTNQLLLKLDELNVKKIIFYSASIYRIDILSLPNNKEDRIEFRDFDFEKYAGSDNYLKLISNKNFLICHIIFLN